jgi:hypothetical protein
VGTSYRRQRVVGVQPRVGFGTIDRVPQGRAAGGRRSTTACIDRLNRDSRQRGAAVGRRVTPLGQGQAGWRQQLVLCQPAPNCCLPHASLRQPLPPPIATQGAGSAKQWRPCTPAMRAGWPEHGWSLQEVRLCRVPSGPQPQRVSTMRPVDARGVERLKWTQRSAKRGKRGVANPLRERMTDCVTPLRRLGQRLGTFSATHRYATAILSP